MYAKIFEKNSLYLQPLVYTVQTSGTYKVRAYATATPHPVKYGIAIARLNVTRPADITYKLGETGHTITWKLDDSAFAVIGGPPPGFTARVYLNGAPLADTFEWDRTHPVSVNVDELAEGTNTYKIVAKNWMNVTVEDTVTVTVEVDLGGTGDIPGYPIMGLVGLTFVSVLAILLRKKQGSVIN